MSFHSISVRKHDRTTPQYARSCETCSRLINYHMSQSPSPQCVGDHQGNVLLTLETETPAAIMRGLVAF